MPERAKRFVRKAVYVPPGERKRPNANARGYGAKWRKASSAYLAEHPLCEACEARGETSGADCVDHKIPHRGNARLFWDVSNWQALCNQCHNSKTGKGQ